MHFAKREGFDGLELVIVESGELRLDCSPQELEAIRQMASEEDIEIISLSNSFNWRCSLTSADGKVRERAKDMILRQLEIAAALGVKVILALPGFVGMDFITNDLHPAVRTHDEKNYHPGQEIVGYGDAYERSISAFKELAPVAGRMGITIGIENIWNHFLLSPIEMCHFIDEINSEYVKSYFDVGNVMPLGHPEQWIRILGSRIVRVHVKDFVKGMAGIRGFVDLLSGDIDFPEVIRALREIGYEGWVTAEVNEKPAYPTFTVRSTAIALDEILKCGGGKEL